MIFWRISAFADLSGRGGFLANGRWHTADRPVVYLAATPAGAMLEILVHLEVDQENFPETLQLLRVEVPDTASMMPAPALKSGWEADTRCSKDLGDTFLKNGVALLMPIPSAIMPHTMKYLFNPMHIESTQAVLTSEVFRLDSRLLRKC